MSQPPPMPIPVQPLGYGMPSPGRPGVVTAIGVLSIVLGSFGILTSCGGFAMSRAFMGFATARSATMSRSSSVRVASSGGGASSNFSTISSTSSNSSASSNTSDASKVSASGDGSGTNAASGSAPPAPTSAATATADGLAALEPITAGQRSQLLALIADRGDWYLGGPNDAGGWTAEDMRKLVRAHGQLTASAGEANPGCFFALDDGRLELHDDYATYHPKGSDPLTVRQTVQPGGYSVMTTQGGGTSNTSVNFRSSGTPMPPIKFSKGVLGISVVMSAASSLLAVLLIVAGAMTLRGSKVGRTLHMIYAIVKLPLAVSAAVVGAMMMSSIFASARSPAGMRGFVIAIGVGSALIPAIYPIVLLIVMQVRVVKEWFGRSEAQQIQWR